MTPCPLPFCQYLQTQAAIKEWEQQFIPCEPVTLRFYNRQKRCVKAARSTDLLRFAQYTDVRFRTELEYVIAIENEIKDKEYSYIEVFDPVSNEFIIRHYVRGGVLSPLWSTEVDARLDPLLKERQISVRPTIDWRKVMNDTMFTKVDKKISIHEFVTRYRFK